MSLRRAASCHYHSIVRPKLTFARKSAYLVILLFSLTLTTHPQQKVELTPPPFNAATYRIGERLTYDVSFAHFMSAAHVELLVAGRGKYFDREGIELRAHVETTGVVNVALLALNNDYTTYVDAATGLPYRSQRVVREAGKTSEAGNDYNQPAGTEAIPNRRMGEFPGTFDLLSATYRLRAMTLGEGAAFFITARNEATEYQAEVKVSGRAMIKTKVGSFNAIMVRVNTKNTNLSNIRIYFSDDEWHVPVLITAKHSDGEIRAELVASELTAPPASASRPTNGQSPRPTPMNSRPPVVPAGSTTNPSNTTGASLNLPFNVGEQLNYRVYLGDNGKSVGSVSFGVTARGRYFNRDGLMFLVTAQTNGDGARVFYVNDKIVSYVDPETLLPFRTELNLSEGKWRSNRAYNLDQDRGAVMTDQKKRIEIPVGTHDIVSLMYALRTFDLSPPKQNAISILVISQPRTLLIKSQRRDTIEIGNQKIPAIFLTLTTDDPEANRLQLQVWVGDDSRHLPLRIAAVTPLGVVRADLAIVPGTAR